MRRRCGQRRRRCPPTRRYPSRTPRVPLAHPLCTLDCPESTPLQEDGLVIVGENLDSARLASFQVDCGDEVKHMVSTRGSFIVQVRTATSAGGGRGANPGTRPRRLSSQASAATIVGRRLRCSGYSAAVVAPGPPRAVAGRGEERRLVQPIGSLRADRRGLGGGIPLSAVRDAVDARARFHGHRAELGCGLSAVPRQHAALTELRQYVADGCALLRAPTACGMSARIVSTQRWSRTSNSQRLSRRVYLH